MKPTYESGSLVEFIRLLPDGVGVIPVYAGIKEHTEQGYLAAMDTYHQCVDELARIGVHLIHPEGGPPFMVRGYKGEQEIVKFRREHNVRSIDGLLALEVFDRPR